MSTPTPSDVQALKQDLQALLEKHKATIAWECGEGSDTYGLYDQTMVISIRDRDVLTVNESYIDAKVLSNA